MVGLRSARHSERFRNGCLICKGPEVGVSLFYAGKCKQSAWLRQEKVGSGWMELSSSSGLGSFRILNGSKMSVL